MEDDKLKAWEERMEVLRQKESEAAKQEAEKLRQQYIERRAHIQDALPITRHRGRL